MARPSDDSPRHVLVAPQEFKGSLTAADAAAAIAAGVRRALPEAEVVELPMADGGPGTASIVGAAAGGRMVVRTVAGPLGDPVEAAYALVEREGEAPFAVIEAAAACGLVLAPPDQRDATLASSYGVGELILDAVGRGARRIVLGVGGTASNDGGAGAAQALGLRLLDLRGQELPRGGIHLARLARVERPAEPSPLVAVDVRVAVDVQNELVGPRGATAVYGPQKGLHDWQAFALEQAIARWAARIRDDLGRDVTSIAGAGAGGGLPAGLIAAIPGVRVESGAALVAEAIGLDRHIARAELVITGEGALDAQTASGKAVSHVVRAAARAGIPCLAVAGVVEGRPDRVADVESLVTGADDPAAIATAMVHGEQLATDSAERLVRRWLAPA